MALAKAEAEAPPRRGDGALAGMALAFGRQRAPVKPATDCLAACPWNRFAREGALMKPHARKDLAHPDLIELLKLDEAGFKSRFAGTPILRTKRRVLLRNVCVALGNTGDASALPALQKAAKDSEPLIAEHAQWAMERIQNKERQV